MMSYRERTYKKRRKETKIMIKKLVPVVLSVFLTVSIGTCVQAADYSSDQALVKEVQEKLNSEGYDCGTPDGVFGAKTSSALKQYQGDHSLTADGIINEELLSAMDLLGEGTEAGEENGGSIEESAEFQNEAAWDELYQAIQNYGRTKNGRVALTISNDEHQTSIGTAPDDDQTIYFSTDAKYGDSSISVSTGLTLSLRRNSPTASFETYNIVPAMGEDEKTFGAVNITTLNSRSELPISMFSNNSGTQPSGSVITQSLGNLLSDSAEILKNTGTSCTMRDLGFGAGLTTPATSELGENETYYRIYNDVYSVFPADWTYSEEDDGSWSIIAISDDDVDALITVSSMEIEHLHQFKEETREKALDDVIKGAGKEMNLSNIQKGIKICGFEGITADNSYVIYGHNFTGKYVSFIVDDTIIMMSLLRNENKPEVDQIFDRVLDSIFVSSEDLSAKEVNATASESDLLSQIDSLSLNDSGIENISITNSDGSGQAVLKSWQYAPEGFLISNDYKSEDILMVMVDYTNLGSQEKMMQQDFYVRAYQNGVELVATPCSYHDEKCREAGNITRRVLGGGTITVAWWWALDDNSPVTIVISDQADSSNSVSTEFNIN